MSLHSRRDFLATAGTVSVVSLAGCATVDGLLGDEWPTTADDTTEPLSTESGGWPQYGRNTRHTGFSPDVRVDDPSEDWTFTLSGSMAPPAIVGNRVIVHGGVTPESEGGNGFTGGAVFSLRTDDGRQEWRRDLPSLGGGYSGCRPIVYRGSVYVGHAGESGLYALDARDGSPRWRHETGNSINEAAVGFRNGIVASTGDELLSFDERGHDQWVYQTGDDRAAFAPPAIGGGSVLYTTGVLGSIVAIDPREGSGISEWRYQSDSTFRTPTVANGRTYVPGSNELHAVDVDTGEGVWTTEVTASSGVATDGSRLFVTTAGGDLVAYETADGSETWRTTLAAGDSVYLRTRPLVTDRSVIVTTDKPQLDERVTTYAVDRRTGETRWTVAQPGNVGFDAVAANGRIYVPVYWSTDERGGTLVVLSD
ncbi:PQQ-binding-like beta-propeller repeat protein [Halorubellus litoreus]|uniref:PQQ-binding-like beta-propeller repeat protein n=1 Tax=Halorubellus litoreus TaxID=755308 RepID=A0ABD5VK13_9EURY